MCGFYLYSGRKRVGYCMRHFFLFEKPKQFKKQSEFYYACLDWHEMDFDGRKYWLADIPATDDPKSDYARVARVKSYLGRSKLKWDVLSADEISLSVSRSYDKWYGHDGKIILDTWLNANVKK